MLALKNKLFERRKNRTRTNIKKNSNGRVRLTVFRSNKHIYAQLIDDSVGNTLASASTLDKEINAKSKKGYDIAAAKEVGALLAARAKVAKIDKVVFDKGGYIFHGRVKALADAARESGLNF